MAASSDAKPGRWPLLFAALILVGTAVLLPREWRRYQQAESAEGQLRDLAFTSQELLSALKDAETGQRGFLLTHDPRYLDPYHDSVNLIPALLQRIRNLSMAQSALAKEAELETATQEKLAELEKTIRLASSLGFPAALGEVQTGHGRELMVHIREIVSAMDRVQIASLKTSREHAERIGQRTILFSALAVLLLSVFLLSATIVSWRAREHEQELVKAERLAFDALQESEARFRLFADNAPVLLWIASADGKRNFFNQGWLSYTGRRLEDESDDGWRDGIFWEDSEGFELKYDQAIREKKAFQQEYRLRRHDGEFRWVVEHGAPRVLPDGKFVGFIGSCIDIHERKTMEEGLERHVEERTRQLRYKEEELMQSRKIEAIGRLAGGVAHDFNNLLTGIMGITEEIREEIPEQDPHRESLGEILKASQRASALTKQLLAFGRRQIVAPVVLNLNTSVNEMSGMLRRLIGEDIQLDAVLDPNVGLVRMDPGQVEQIVINLVLNARDAMSNGGRISIETSNMDVDENYTKKHFEILPGPYVLLAVSDTGMGMEADTQLHAFEPFYTTKEKGKGSGMGLATVYGIVKQNNGDIFLYSTPGSGTTFKIYFPRTTETVTSREAAPVAVVGGDETILLVEDEEIVRQMANRALIRAGYKVLEAKHGQEALIISASYQGSIHLLLTDVIMPGLNGRQVAELLQPQRPTMRVLYTSGYTENIIAQRGMLKPGIAFIEKSFTAAALCAKVREVLDVRPSKS